MDVSFVTAVGGLLSGAVVTYVTAKSFYVKRQDELRDRQQKELERYAEGKKKEYAAERDFGHLMRQYEGLASNLNTLHELGDRRLDGIEDDLRVIKGLLQLLAVAVGQTETGIQRYLKHEE